MKAQPKTILNSVIERIGFITEAQNPDFFIMNGIRVDGENLLKTDRPFLGHVVLGMLSSISGDGDDMEYHFNKARSLNHDWRVVELNYVTSLNRIGHHDKESVVLTHMSKIMHDDLEVLKFILEPLVNLGLYESASNVIQGLESMGVVGDPWPAWLIIEAFKKNFTQETDANCLCISNLKMAREKFGLLPLYSILTTPMDEDGSFEDYVFLDIIVSSDGDFDNIMDCDAAISENAIMYGVEHNIDLSNIVFGCRPKGDDL